jgi:hypothetical protein
MTLASVAFELTKIGTAVRLETLAIREKIEQALCCNAYSFVVF